MKPFYPQDKSRRSIGNGSCNDGSEFKNNAFGDMDGNNNCGFTGYDKQSLSRSRPQSIENRLGNDICRALINPRTRETFAQCYPSVSRLLEMKNTEPFCIDPFKADFLVQCLKAFYQSYICSNNKPNINSNNKNNNYDNNNNNVVEKYLEFGDVSSSLYECLSNVKSPFSQKIQSKYPNNVLSLDGWSKRVKYRGPESEVSKITAYILNEYNRRLNLNFNSNSDSQRQDKHGQWQGQWQGQGQAQGQAIAQPPHGQGGGAPMLSHHHHHPQQHGQQHGQQQGFQGDPRFQGYHQQQQQQQQQQRSQARPPPRAQQQGHGGGGGGQRAGSMHNMYNQSQWQQQHQEQKEKSDQLCYDLTYEIASFIGRFGPAGKKTPGSARQFFRFWFHNNNFDKKIVLNHVDFSQLYIEMELTTDSHNVETFKKRMEDELKYRMCSSCGSLCHQCEVDGNCRCRSCCNRNNRANGQQNINGSGQNNNLNNNGHGGNYNFNGSFDDIGKEVKKIAVYDKSLIHVLFNDSNEYINAEDISFELHCKNMAQMQKKFKDNVSIVPVDTRPCDVKIELYGQQRDIDVVKNEMRHLRKTNAEKCQVNSCPNYVKKHSKQLKRFSGRMCCQKCIDEISRKCANLEQIQGQIHATDERNNRGFDVAPQEQHEGHTDEYQSMQGFRGNNNYTD